MLWQREAFYGGAAGGGKSDALLDGALQYVDVPGYAALLLRRTYKNLAQPGALMDRSQDWLGGTDARWSGSDHAWHFPGGSTLQFGHLQNEVDKFNYSSTEFQYIGFDELTEFTESQYRFLFSRLRRRRGLDVPLRMRSASNPGGIGHEWVRRRFITEGVRMGRPFIPAKLSDNPNLDPDEYTESLMQLDPVTRAQLLEGNWSARTLGGMFKREQFIMIDADEVPDRVRWLRYWDLAATEVKPGREPDWTAGGLVGFFDGCWYLGGMERFQAEPSVVENRLSSRAKQDGNRVAIRMEQEPGSSGKIVVDHYARRVFFGYDFAGIPSTGSKADRAAPLSAAAGNGLVYIVRGPWVSEFLDEADGFPMGAHDDQVDAVSGGVNALASQPVPNLRWV
jgi:predicted phage terminase large subunit-like protein